MLSLEIISLHKLCPLLLHRCVAIFVSASQRHIFSHLLPRNLISPTACGRYAPGCEILVVIQCFGMSVHCLHQEVNLPLVSM